MKADVHGKVLSDNDRYLFAEGRHERLYQCLGAHHCTQNSTEGVCFSVWAPNASYVSVVGDFNHWDRQLHSMHKDEVSGIWELFIAAMPASFCYKFNLEDAHGQSLPLKADPYAQSMEHPPNTASRLTGVKHYNWQDAAWLRDRDSAGKPYQRPVSIYEVHLGSWRRKNEQDNRYLSYLELAEELIPYVLDLGFTHIELMPITEYPFDGSWGYQPLGLFAPSIRFGVAEELKTFIDRCHSAGIGVILDWVPGHFPTDAHGIGCFDGSSLYEHEDHRRGFHPDWNTLIYDFGSPQVISYLLSNAIYWIDEFHFDGLRMDAVASMLYLDYSRDPGQWLPNVHGGRENLEAIEFVRLINSRVAEHFPGVMMIAEESTAWPGVTHDVAHGGLGFGFKWNMGWMNDCLRYMARDPVHRQFHHNEVTFSLMYSFTENFILPLSHDEVVHGKRSLLEKMPGDEWQQFANLRTLYALMWLHPGKKLLFMGGEFAQRSEWNHDTELAWGALNNPLHKGVQRLIRDLNHLYCGSPSLHEYDSDQLGFEWLMVDNHAHSIFAFIRRGSSTESFFVVVLNMTPTPHHDFSLGVPNGGSYIERLNTDSAAYGGSNMGNLGSVQAEAIANNEHPFRLSISVPPLSASVFEWRSE